MIFRQFYFFNQLRRNQWLGLMDLKKLQFKKLKAIVHHAYNSVEFYHKLYHPLGIGPQTLNNLEDLNKFPIITKEDIQKNFPNKLLAKNKKLTNCTILHTAGSTGKPLTVLLNPEEMDFSLAVNLRSLYENGFRFRDKMLAVSTNPPKRRSLAKILHFLPTEYISLYDNPYEQKNRLNSLKIACIFGHTSYVKILAKAKYDCHLDRFNPRLIFTSAEILDKATRKMINTVFNTDLKDLYGCVELNRTAWECKEHMGYHMDIDSVVFEFIKNGEQIAFNEQGEVVYTGLYNYTMPLIRYAIGDIAIPSDEKCPCGRNLPLIKIIEGRTFDFIVLPDNRIYSPLIFINSLRPIRGIKEFKVIQENLHYLKIYYIRKKSDKSDLEKQITFEVQKILGNEIRIEPIEVNELPSEPSGKKRYVKSNMKINWIGK